MKKLDEFDYHELMDRAYLAYQFFEDNVLQHPAAKRTASLRRAAAKVSKSLAEFYQLAGWKRFETEASDAD